MILSYDLAVQMLRHGSRAVRLSRCSRLCYSYFRYPTIELHREPLVHIHPEDEYRISISPKIQSPECAKTIRAFTPARAEFNKQLGRVVVYKRPSSKGWVLLPNGRSLLVDCYGKILNQGFEYYGTTVNKNCDGLLSIKQGNARLKHIVDGLDNEIERRF